MVTRFVSRVGRSRVGAGVSSDTASNTTASRQEMASIVKEYKRFVDHVEENIPQVLTESLAPVLALSKIYVPKDTRVLERSAYLSQTVFRGIPTVEIGYGKGGFPEYAAKVHEDLEARHDSPTSAKFLQRALEEEDAETKARILNRLKQTAGL